MNRRSLAYHLATELQIEVPLAHRIIESFFTGITLGLAREELVRIDGFGSFQSWSRSPHSRVACDPIRISPIGPLELGEQTVIRFVPD
jgi:nucleoid DNA-binding protein